MLEIRRAPANYLIGLLQAVLNQTVPEEKPDEITFEEVFQTARFHCVSSMAYYAIEKLKDQPEASLKACWRKERERNISKSFNQLIERDLILKKLTEAGIDVLPLKGCLLKEMYPQADYREMADLDILIAEDKAKLARKQMELMGYTTEHFDVSNHDNYLKPPYMGVELHRNMIPKDYDTHTYYKDVWKKAIPDEERARLFHFSWDDYYIFMLTHFAKHYFSGGSGIRSIMDISVFLKKHEKDLDQNYLKQELDTMNLYEFKQTAEQLANCWFADGKVSKETEEMAQYVITSGVYGTRERNTKNQLHKAEKKANSLWIGKVSYVLSRIFLPYRAMCFSFPFLKKVPILLPFCWVVRLILSVIKKKERVKAEFRVLNAAKKTDEKDPVFDQHNCE